MIGVIISSTFLLYGLSSSSTTTRRLLQFPGTGSTSPFNMPSRPVFGSNLPNNPNSNPNPNPNPNPFGATPGLPQTAMVGAYGQICVPPQPDFMCRVPGQLLTDLGSGKIECNTGHSCCLCGSLSCGYSPNGPMCDGILANAPSALLGVKQIYLRGKTQGSGAVIDCGAPDACDGATFMGTWIDTVVCSAPDSCTGVVMELSYSKGIVCGVRSCIDAEFTLTDNRMSAVSCSGELSCARSFIYIDGNVEGVTCGGDQSCRGAQIVVVDPMEHFFLSCNGDRSCEDLKIFVSITKPTTPCPATVSYMQWKGITCGANGACLGMQFTLQNEGCQPVVIEDLTCEAGQSCTGSIFDFHSGVNSLDIFITNCKCGPSCSEASGIDKCYNNMRIAECTAPSQCAAQQHIVSNVANSFKLICSDIESCAALDLTLDISGGSQNIIRNLDGIQCSGFRGCADMIIRVRNTQFNQFGVPIIIDIENVLCTAQESCENAVFLTGPNVKISNIRCDGLNACRNCVVKPYETDVGYPCQPLTTTTATPITMIHNDPPALQVPVIQTPITTTSRPIPSIPKYEVPVAIQSPQAPVTPLDIPTIPNNQVPVQQQAPNNPTPGVIPQIPAVQIPVSQPPNIPNIPQVSIPQIPNIPNIPNLAIPPIPPIAPLPISVDHRGTAPLPPIQALAPKQATSATTTTTTNPPVTSAPPQPQKTAQSTLTQPPQVIQQAQTTLPAEPEVTLYPIPASNGLPAAIPVIEPPPIPTFTQVPFEQIAKVNGVDPSEYKAPETKPSPGTNFGSQVIPPMFAVPAAQTTISPQPVEVAGMGGQSAPSVSQPLPADNRASNPLPPIPAVV